MYEILNCEGIDFARISFSFANVSYILIARTKQSQVYRKRNERALFDCSYESIKDRIKGRIFIDFINKKEKQG